MKSKAKGRQNTVYIQGKMYDASEDSVCFNGRWYKVNEDQEGDLYFIFRNEVIYLDRQKIDIYSLLRECLEDYVASFDATGCSEAQRMIAKIESALQEQ